MSYAFYKFLHLIGLTSLILGLGGAIIGTYVVGQKPSVGRKAIAITHGLGMLLMLVGGFGMLARLGMQWPWWISVKLFIWLALGAWIVVAYRLSTKHFLAVWLTPLLLVAVAAGVVLAK